MNDDLTPDHVRLAADLLARHPGLPCRALFVYADEVRVDVASAADVERWAAAGGTAVTASSLGPTFVRHETTLPGWPLPLHVSATTRAEAAAA